MKTKLKGNFIRCPKPIAPRLSTLLLKVFRTGQAVQIIIALSPTRIFNVSLRVCLASIVIGAYRKYPLTSITSFATRSFDSGNTVKQLTMIVPVFCEDNIPCLLAITASTCGEPATHRIGGGAGPSSWQCQPLSVVAWPTCWWVLRLVLSLDFP